MLHNVHGGARCDYVNMLHPRSWLGHIAPDSLGGCGDSAAISWLRYTHGVHTNQVIVGNLTLTKPSETTYRYD